MFYEPPTVLHVSRGISANDPTRLNCGPEITRLVLELNTMVEPRELESRPLLAT